MLRAEEDGTELKLSLNREMLHGSVFLPVIGNRFVKGNIFVLSYIIRLAHPDRLHAVEVLPLVADLLDFLGLLLLLCLVFVDLLYLRLVVVVIVFIIIARSQDQSRRTNPMTRSASTSCGRVRTTRLIL